MKFGGWSLLLAIFNLAPSHENLTYRLGDVEMRSGLKYAQFQVACPTARDLQFAGYIKRVSIFHVTLVALLSDVKVGRCGNCAVFFHCAFPVTAQFVCELQLDLARCHHDLEDVQFKWHLDGKCRGKCSCKIRTITYVFGVKMIC